MTSLTLLLLLVTFPLWTGALYVHFALEDDLRYYFEGWQPKAALSILCVIIIVIYVLPPFLEAQIAAATSRRASKLFTLAPSIAVAMIIFPDIIETVPGINPLKNKTAMDRSLYRGFGWIFLIFSFIAMWIL